MNNIKNVFFLFFILIAVFNIYSSSRLIKEFEIKISNLIEVKEKISIYKKYIKKLYWDPNKGNDLNIITNKYFNFVKKKNLEKQRIYAYSDYGFSLARIGKLKESEEILKMTQKLMKNERNIEKKIYFLNSLFYLFGKNNTETEKIFELSKKIKLLYKKKGDIYNEACFTYIGANILMSKGKDKERLPLYEKALKLFRKIGNKRKSVMMVEYIGFVYIKLRKYDKALEVFLKGLKLGEKIKDYENIGRINLSIGDLYSRRKDNKKAYFYYIKAKESFSKLGYNAYSIRVNQKIGEFYYNLKKYKKALYHYKSSLSEQLIIKKITKNKIEGRLAQTYIYIGKIYIKLKNYNQANYFFNKPFSYVLSSKSIKLLAQVYNGFGNLYNKKKTYKKSINNLLKSILYTKKIKDDLLQKENYYLLYQNYEILKDYKNSLTYHKLYFDLERKIFNEKNTKNIADIETKYETEKKDLEISSLQKINEVKEREKKLLFREKNLIKKQQRYTIYAIVFGVLFVLIFLFFLIKKYKLLMAFWKKKNFVGKYKLDKKIASGGMGIVYKAFDILDKDKKKSFAIKVLREEYFENEEMKKRFKIEGLMIDQLDHKNIVKVFERGESADLHYLVMEYLSGITLSELLKKKEKLIIKEALSIMFQTANAISTIHRKGIIHRDLKPENIMLVKSENNEPWLVKLLDFGLAKSETMTKMTMTGMVMGTSNYISPEHLTGEIGTIASDIYSLGVIFYEMLSGERLFTGNSEEIVFHKILEQERVSLIEKRTDIAPELNNLVMDMIDKNTKKRPDIKQVLEIIEEIK